MDLLADANVDLNCKRECLWALSNIVVGTPEQMMYVFDNPEFVSMIFKYCMHENPKVCVGLNQDQERSFMVCLQLYKNSSLRSDKQAHRKRHSLDLLSQS